MARPEDDARIGELLVEAFIEAYAKKMPEVVVHDQRKAELRDVAGKRKVATVLAAEAAGQVVGTVAIYPPGAPGSEAWIGNAADLRHLATDVSLHGKGLAAKLLDEAERIAREEWKAVGICLHVRRGAHGVARLYEKRGFKREPAGDFERPGVFLEGYFLSFA